MLCVVLTNVTHLAHGKSVLTVLPTYKKVNNYTFNIQNHS